MFLLTVSKQQSASAHSELLLASKGRAKRHGGILCSSATSPALARTHGRAFGIRSGLREHEVARRAPGERVQLGRTLKGCSWVNIVGSISMSCLNKTVPGVGGVP